MSEIDVKRQSSSLERSRTGGMTHRQPFRSLLSLNPPDLLASPFSLMRRFTEDMDRLFEEAGGWRRSASDMWVPAIEVFQHDGRLEVLADLPGLNEKDVKVQVTDEGLAIQGERRRDHEEQREGFHRSERSYGQFYRLIPLPEGANLDQARAEFRNGELHVTIPIPEQQHRNREIPITSADRKQPASQAPGKDQAAKAG